MSETGRGQIDNSSRDERSVMCSILRQYGGKQNRRDVSTHPSDVALTCHPPERKIADVKHCHEGREENLHTTNYLLTTLSARCRAHEDSSPPIK